MHSWWQPEYHLFITLLVHTHTNTRTLSLSRAHAWTYDSTATHLHFLSFEIVFLSCASNTSGPVRRPLLIRLASISHITTLERLSQSLDVFRTRAQTHILPLHIRLKIRTIIKYMLRYALGGLSSSSE